MSEDKDLCIFLVQWHELVFDNARMNNIKQTVLCEVWTDSRLILVIFQNYVHKFTYGH